MEPAMATPSIDGLRIGPELFNCHGAIRVYFLVVGVHDTSRITPSQSILVEPASVVDRTPRISMVHCLNPILLRFSAYYLL